MKWIAVWVCPFILFLFLVVNVGCSINETLRMELIHRTKLSNGMHRKPSIQLMRELLRSDQVRLRVTSEKLRGSVPRPRREAEESGGGGNVVQSGLSSAADYGASQYLVRFRVGSPSQKLSLIADTGSDLTWMNCVENCSLSNCSRRRPSSRGLLRRRRFFRPANSTSFTTVPCSSDFCKVGLSNLFSLKRCPTHQTPCAYDYRYFDGSSALGIFATESVRLERSSGGTTRLKDVVVGCSYSSQGSTFRAADGVLGLGFSDYSFVVTVSTNFGGRFSYCLMDHWSHNNVSNFLTFGKTPSEATASGNMQFTNLVLGVLIPYYALNVVGISMGGVLLNIPSQVWVVSNGPAPTGTILESGSSLTTLTEPAYKPLMAVLKPAVSRFKRLDLDLQPLDYCFNATGFDESVIPSLAFHFAGGAVFRPPVKSYIIDVEDGVKCLGIVSGVWPGTSYIGNIMQQDHLWEFDLLNSKLGFVPSNCS